MRSAPWVTRFKDIISVSDFELDRLVELRAVPVKLGGDTPDADSEMLRAGLERVFLSGTQVRKVIRRLLDLARSHAKSHLSSEDAFLAGLYKPFPWGKTPGPAICLSGLAGVGKSQVLEALVRILPSTTTIGVRGHANIPLVSSWPMTLRDGIGLNALLMRYLDLARTEEELSEAKETPKNVKSIGLPALLSLARRRSWRDGVCLLWVDEFQFVSHGSDANARATALLLQLLGIGPRLVFVANYSLGHKLKKRNQEDRQRLVSQPLILEPERCSSDDWKALVAEYRNVAPSVLAFDVDSAETLLHRYTFGIKRLAVDLLVCAYREARRRGKCTVGLEEIRHAYTSSSYTSNREDVETLWRQHVAGKMLRSDLWCPFDQFSQGGTDIEGEATNVAVARRAIETFEAKIEDQLLDSSLLPEEKEAVQRLEASETPRRKPATVIRMRRPKATKESLQQACGLFDEE